MFVLGTNVVSELRKVRAGKANPGVAEWASSIPSDQMFLSSITLHELELGVLLAERSDPSRGTLLRSWLDTALVHQMTVVTRNVRDFERFDNLDVVNPWG